MTAAMFAVRVVGVTSSKEIIRAMVGVANGQRMSACG